MNTQIKVFVVQCIKTSLSYYNPGLLDNQSFMKLARQQNGVYSIKEFTDKFNANPSMFTPEHKIRFINIIYK